jgi:hypothetical protein
MPWNFILSKFQEDLFLFATGFLGLVLGGNGLIERWLCVVFVDLDWVLLLILDEQLHLHVYLFLQIQFDRIVIDKSSLFLLKGQVLSVFLAVNDEIKVELGRLFEVAHEWDTEVSHFEQVKVIHLLLYCIGHLSLDDLVLDEDLANCLLTPIQDVHLAW